MKTTALIYYKNEDSFQGNEYFNLREVLRYILHRYTYQYLYKAALFLSFISKPANKRNRIAMKNEVPWVEYCLKTMEKSINIINSFTGASSYDKMQYINLRELVEGIVRKRRRLATMVGVEIVVSIKEEVFIYTNRALLDIIIRNILDNAIQFSDEKKRKKSVNISAIDAWEDLLISIKDNGIGILHEEANSIFKMFYQVSPTSPGIGVGLFLAKKAVEKVNGSIDVISSVGLGSEFLIQMPSAIYMLQSIRDHEEKTDIDQ